VPETRVTAVNFLPQTLKARLATVIMLMALGALWILALALNKFQEKRLQELLSAQQLSAVDYVAEDIDNKIKLRLNGLQMIADRFPVDTLASEQRIRSFLAERRAIYNLFDGGLIVIKPDGSGAYADYPAVPGRLSNAYAQLSPFRDVIATSKPAVGPPRVGRAIGQPVVVFAAPVLGADGQLVAILAGVTQINSANFLDLVAKPRLDASGDYIVVAPEHGVFVTGTDPSYTLRPLPPAGADTMHDRYMQGFQGSGVAVSSTGVEELTSARRIPTTGWFAVARLPTADAYASIREGRNWTLVGATLLSLLIALITLLTLRRALRPLTEAAGEMQAMTRGEMPLHPLALAGPSEVVGLADSFNQLQEQISRKEAELRQAVNFSNTLLDSLPGIFFRLDGEGRLAGWNESLATMLGPEALARAQQDVMAIIHEADRHTIADKIREGFEQALAEAEGRLLLKDGSTPWFRFVARTLSIGGQIYLLGTGIDITEQKDNEVRLKLAASVFTHAREGIMITDADGNIVDVNDTFTRITGYSRAEAVGQNPRILKSGRQTRDHYTAMWRSLLEDGYWVGEAWNRRKDGEVYAELLTVGAVRDTENNVLNYVALFTDITPMKEQQQQLERIAHFDALTGLPNRVLLADRLQQALAHNQRRKLSLAVVYLDLDGFKAVNDNHGHDVGDELLITVSHRMRTALREGDTLARIGGDEFVAVLADLDRPDDCEPLLERLMQAAAEPVRVGDARLQVSASIGFALSPQQGLDADLLLRQADQAMYQAKQAGKNRYRRFDAGHTASDR